MLTLLLAALGSALAHAGAIELKVWHAYRGEERAVLEDLLDRYAASHPDVRPVPLAIPHDAFAPKLEAAAPRGNGPDLFIAAHERLGSWSAAGIAAPIELPADAFHPLTVEALTWEERTWGAPLAFKCVALYYDRAQIPEPPATTGAMLDLARRSLGEGAFGLAYEAATPYYQAAWMHGFGGGVFDESGTVRLDRPGNARAFAFARSLVDEGFVPEDATGALVTRLFNDGKAAMVLNGPWFAGEIAPERDWAVAPLPVVDETGLPAAPWLTVEAAMVSGFARHPSEARELAVWLARDTAVERAVRGRQPVAALAAWDDPRVSGDPVLGAFRVQLDRSVPMPARPEMAETWEPLARALRRALRGTASPEEAAAQAQREFEVLSRPPPPAAEPAPYLLAGAALASFGLALAGRRAWRERAAIARWRFAYAWIAPIALALGVLVLVPFAVGATVSLFAHRDGTWTFVGFAHFADILLARTWPALSPLSFWYALGVTVLWTTANVALHMAIGVVLALFLREPWVRLRPVWRVLLVVPWAVPNYITALVWKGMFHRQFGALNALLGVLGIEPVSWFSHFWTAFAANVATNTWLGFPFMMVVTLGALQSIPRELEQAAEVDGATGWQRLRHVTLPLLAPSLVPAAILGSVWTFNMFNIVYLVSGGEPDGSTEILVSEAYKWAFTRGHRYGYAAAYAVLVFGALLLWSRITRRIGERVAA